MTTEQSTTPITDDIIAKLRERYAQPEVPPCPVCNGPRTSVCEAGGGRVTYCCASEDAQPVGKGDRFEVCMDHFSKSRYETTSGDSRVIQVCADLARTRAALEGCKAALRLFPAAVAEAGDKGGSVYIDEWERFCEAVNAALAAAEKEGA